MNVENCLALLEKRLCRTRQLLAVLLVGLLVACTAAAVGPLGDIVCGSLTLKNADAKNVIELKASGDIAAEGKIAVGGVDVGKDLNMNGKITNPGLMNQLQGLREKIKGLREKIEELESVRVENGVWSGNVNTAGWNLNRPPLGGGVTFTSAVVNFPRPFTRPLEVTVGLVGFDFEGRRDQHIQVGPANVASTGFQMRILSWGNCNVGNAVIQWTARGK